VVWAEILDTRHVGPSGRRKKGGWKSNPDGDIESLNHPRRKKEKARNTVCRSRQMLEKSLAYYRVAEKRLIEPNIPYIPSPFLSPHLNDGRRHPPLESDPEE
jgi:hypothetical protein